MKELFIHCESVDLGEKAGDAFTTVEQPNKVHIQFDPSRLPNPNGLRDLIMRELDTALLALIYGVQPQQLKDKADEIAHRPGGMPGVTG